MSIKVKNVSKLYGEQRVLNNISFEVGAGEVVGFLGPNGAGKSTMMKILTCFIPKSSGSVQVADFDVENESLEVRRNIGYLPEHNPLYLDLYIKEYLEFIAGLHKLNNVKQCIADMIDLTGLSAEKNKKIGALSKGYRQRVGIAQALIHNPKVLILDEPTTGLDPNQLDEIRSLIVEIGKEKTVLLSSHIMQEVEAVCSRVIILNKGEIVANEKTNDLQNSQASQKIIVEFDKPVASDVLNKIPGIKSLVNTNDNLWVLESDEDTDFRSVIFRFAVANNLIILTLQNVEKKLEDVFKTLTK
jgi:ABC-2 type transport system ATP-binding protein